MRRNMKANPAMIRRMKVITWKCFIIFIICGLVPYGLLYFLYSPRFLESIRDQDCPFDPFSAENENPTQLFSAYEKFHRCSFGTIHAKYTILFAPNGLGNRMNGVLSTYLYSIFAKRVLLIWWVTNEYAGCPAEWNDLFKERPIQWDLGNKYAYLATFGAWDLVKRKIYDVDITTDLPSVKKWLSSGNFEENSLRYEWFNTYDNLFELFRMNHHYHDHYLFRKTNAALFEEMSLYLLRPARVIEKEVMGMLEELVIPRRSIGIHIRSSHILDSANRTRYAFAAHSIAKSEEITFGYQAIAAIDNDVTLEELRSTGLIPTLIPCCDDRNEKQKADRSSVRGIQNALKTMLVLNNCQYLVGTWASSFSWVSRNLGFYRTLNYRKRGKGNEISDLDSSCDDGSGMIWPNCNNQHLEECDFVRCSWDEKNKW